MAVDLLLSADNSAKNIIKGGNLVCSDLLFLFRVNANFLFLNSCLALRGFRKGRVGNVSVQDMGVKADNLVSLSAFDGKY